MAENNRRAFLRLDNTAIVFPAITGKKNPNVFRLCATLKDRVDGDVLQQALEQTMEKIPSLRLRLKRGLFWYFFQQNLEPLVVAEEKDSPCLYFSRHENNGYLFRVTYFSHQINLEINHVLTDGTGGMLLLETLICQYVALKYRQKCPLHPSILGHSHLELEEDAYGRCCPKKIEKTIDPLSRAYQIIGSPLSHYQTLGISGIFESQELQQKAKEKNVTLTCYLASVLVLAIYHGNYKYFGGREKIVISLPVNLRKFYPTHTLRNFFLAVPLEIFVEENSSFDEILKQVKSQMEKTINEGYLFQKFGSHVQAQKNYLLRFLPLVLKELGLRFTYGKNIKGHSCTFSNIGVVALPENIKPYVERMEINISPSPSHPIKTSLVSCCGKTVFHFAQNIEETDVAKYFFRFLQKEGLEIMLRGNEVEL